MKFEITLEKAEELALCIVHNQLNEDEACEYVKAFLLDSDNSLYEEKNIIENGE